MALPTPDNLKTMDYVYKGQPFVDVPAKPGIDLSAMDYVYKAQPFVSNGEEGIPPLSFLNYDSISVEDDIVPYVFNPVVLIVPIDHDKYTWGLKII